jgi:hypothetical protein
MVEIPKSDAKEQKIMGGFSGNAGRKAGSIPITIRIIGRS